MGKNTSQKVSMYLKSLKDYYYALPGFLPIVRAPFLYDRNADYTLTLRPEGLTRPWWKVYRNTLPPATVSRDWQISFKNLFKQYVKDEVDFPTNIVLRPINVTLTYELWNGYNQLQQLLSLLPEYPDAVITVEYVLGLPLNNDGYNAIRAKRRFIRYWWHGIF